MFAVEGAPPAASGDLDAGLGVDLAEGWDVATEDTPRLAPPPPWLLPLAGNDDDGDDDSLLLLVVVVSTLSWLSITPPADGYDEGFRAIEAMAAVEEGVRPWCLADAAATATTACLLLPARVLRCTWRTPGIARTEWGSCDSSQASKYYPFALRKETIEKTRLFERNKSNARPDFRSVQKARRA